MSDQIMIFNMIISGTYTLNAAKLTIVNPLVRQLPKIRLG